MTTTMLYPDLDPDAAVYRAGVIYVDGGIKLIPPGGHSAFRAAADRARRLRKALMDAGELGLKAYVTVSGERPRGFPRHGVTL